MPTTDSRRRRLHTTVKLKGHKLTHEQLLEIDKCSHIAYYGGPGGSKGGHSRKKLPPPRQPPTSVELGLTFRELASRLAPNCAQRVTWRDLWMYQRYRCVRGQDLNTKADEYRFPCEWFSYMNGEYAHPPNRSWDWGVDSNSFFDWANAPTRHHRFSPVFGWDTPAEEIQKKQAEAQKQREEAAKTAPRVDYDSAAAQWWKEEVIEKRGQKRAHARYCRPKRRGPPERSSPSVWEPAFLWRSQSLFVDHPCRRDKGRWHMQINNGKHYKELRNMPEQKKEDLTCKWLERDPPNFLPYLKRYFLRLERKRSVAEWQEWIDQLEKDKASTHYHKHVLGADKVRFAWKAMLEHYLWDSTHDLDSEFWEWAAARNKWANKEGCEGVEYSEC